MLPSLRKNQCGSLWGPAASLFLLLGVTRGAHAAGLEETVGGALGLGRAACFARVNDFLAT